MKDPKLIEAQKLVQEVADDIETLDAEGALGVPPSVPSPEEVADLAGAGAPEDLAAPETPEAEALNLLRDIATGIDRLADELAPIEPEEPIEPEGEKEGEEKGEEEPPALPEPEEDEGVVSGETMPVATGA